MLYKVGHIFEYVDEIIQTNATEQYLPVLLLVGELFFQFQACSLIEQRVTEGQLMNATTQSPNYRP